LYTLHIANKNYSSWSLRPWVLLKELGIPFAEAFHRFEADKGGRSFSHFSPNGKVPLLVDGDVNVWDSLAIAEYVAEAHPQVWPADRTARAWARSAAAEMHSGFSELRNVCGMNVGVRAELKTITPALHADLVRMEELWADGLSRFGGPFLAGEHFTAADAFFCPVAYRVQTYGLPMGEKARGYAFRLLTLDSMIGWSRAALAENFRDHSHEDELHIHATVTEDHRAAETA
jgi:glutathione S-transferase